MNTPEYYEKLAKKTVDIANGDASNDAARKFCVQQAQVYATLAVAAATDRLTKVQRIK